MTFLQISLVEGIEADSGQLDQIIDDYQAEMKGTADRLHDTERKLQAKVWCYFLLNMDSSLYLEITNI